MTLRARPQAKLNLTLGVGPRGEDGFHPLRSVFLRIGLADELIVDFAADSAGDRLTVDGLPGCPVEGNLVLRALELVRGAVGQRLPPLAAHLEKRIPLGAGLGGGSSDGAAALELAARAWGVGLAPGLASELEVALGADVPFFARGGPVALVEGRGERVTPLPAIRGEAGILLATSAEPLGAGAVYARFDDLGGASAAAGEGNAERATDELVGALRDGLDGSGLAAFATRLREANDLWPAAASLAPELAGRQVELERLTDRPWLLSGSGRTLFAVYPSPAEAQADGRRLAEGRSDGLSGVTFIATDLAGQSDSGRQA